jgi:predicted RNase H-like nuclease (RuvC/YqgF family)
MSLAGLPEWVSELISKGESVSACLSLYKEMQATEREERASEREMRKTEIEQTYRLKAAEMERDVRLKELEFKEKELSQGANQVHSSDKLKSKLPKFKEGDDPDVYLRSFERLLVLHKVHKCEWALRLIPLLTGKALWKLSPDLVKKIV